MGDTYSGIWVWFAAYVVAYNLGLKITFLAYFVSIMIALAFCVFNDYTTSTDSSENVFFQTQFEATPQANPSFTVCTPNAQKSQYTIPYCTTPNALSQSDQLSYLWPSNPPPCLHSTNAPGSDDDHYAKQRINSFYLYYPKYSSSKPVWLRCRLILWYSG